MVRSGDEDDQYRSRPQNRVQQRPAKAIVNRPADQKRAGGCCDPAAIAGQTRNGRHHRLIIAAAKPRAKMIIAAQPVPATGNSTPP